MADKDYFKIKRCVNSEMGSQLLVKYGDITNAILPPVKYVPTIVLNEKYDKDFDTRAREDLLETLTEIHLQKKNTIKENMVSANNPFSVIMEVCRKIHLFVLFCNKIIEYYSL